MARNFAREHMLRTLARKAPPAEDAGDAGATQHEALLRALSAHKSRLKSLQSIEAKVEYKRDALPDLMPWVDGVLASDRGGQDPVVAHALPWLLDVGDYDNALKVGAYVIRHKLKLPDEYSRTPATFIADAIADSAIKAIDTGRAPNLAAVLAAIELTDGHDMPDIVRAKLHKAAGMAEFPKSVPDRFDDETAGPLLRAEAHLTRAYSLFPNVGVKKPMERLQKYAAEYARHKASTAGATETHESASKTDGPAGDGMSAPPPDNENPGAGEGSPTAPGTPPATP